MLQKIANILKISKSVGENHLHQSDYTSLICSFHWTGFFVCKILYLNMMKMFYEKWILYNMEYNKSFWDNGVIMLPERLQKIEENSNKVQ